RAGLGGDAGRPRARHRRGRPDRRPRAGGRRRLAHARRLRRLRDALDARDRRGARGGPRAAADRPPPGGGGAGSAALRDVGMRAYVADPADGVHCDRLRRPVPARLRLLLPPREAPGHHVPPGGALLCTVPRVRGPADLRKLLGKEPVVSTTTSWVFRATPYVLVATMLVTALVVPILVARPALGFAGNIILLMYLFMLGTFFLALAGLDSGSAFGGMGSSREVAIAALAEPTIILAVFALALRAETINLGDVVERLAREPLLAANPAHLLAFVAFFIVMLAETGRLPVDNPATHLELTMIHEAMVLEYSGRYLALVEWA